MPPVPALVEDPVVAGLAAMRKITDELNKYMLENGMETITEAQNQVCCVHAWEESRGTQKTNSGNLSKTAIGRFQ